MLKKLDTKTKEIITIFVGLCIVFGRVVIPVTFKVNTFVVLLELLLEIIILVFVCYLNKSKLKELLINNKQDKFWNILKKSVLAFLIFRVVATPFVVVLNLVFPNFTDVLTSVSHEFYRTLPVVVIISQVIVAPIVEEIVFRLTLKNLISSKILFIIVSSLLFAFIHDWFYFTNGFLIYFFFGIGMAIAYLKVKDIRYMIGGHILNNIIAAISTLIFM